jgi:glycosyltransferase involved in cell wall biosynthesis
VRIALICSHFPPLTCGVGDHTARIADGWTRAGNQVDVYTAQANPAPPSGVRVHSIGTGGAAHWNRASYQSLLTQVLEAHSDAIVLQYTPYLYGSRGLHPELLAFVHRLRARSRAPLVLSAHELHYPVGVSPDRLILGTSQLAQFTWMASRADSIWVTLEKHELRWKRRMPWKRWEWYPVGSNIELREDSLSSPLVSPDDRALLLFGTSHPTRLMGHAFSALERCLSPDRGVKLVIVGQSASQVAEELKTHHATHLASSVRSLGFIPPEQVSAWLSRAELVLAPFLDGISTRRGSVMAAFERGKPVLTTLSYSSDPSIDWRSFCAIGTDASDFGRACAELLQNPAERKRLGDAALAFHRAHFDWKVICARTLASLEQLGRR